MDENACVCTGCDMHDICRQKPEPDDDMCTWCATERAVENRWQEMIGSGDGVAIVGEVL